MKTSNFITVMLLVCSFSCSRVNTCKRCNGCGFRKSIYENKANINLVKSWYDNGNLKSLYALQDGNVIGVNCEWYSNGNKKKIFEVIRYDTILDPITASISVIRHDLVNMWYPDGTRKQMAKKVRDKIKIIRYYPTEKWRNVGFYLIN